MTHPSETPPPRSIGARALDLAEVVVAWCAGLALIVVTLTIFFNATGRYLTGWSFLGGEELARLLTVWITFVGAFAMVRSSGHVNIDLLLRAVGPRMERVFRGFTGVVGAATMGYLAVTAFQLTQFSFNAGQYGTTLPVPRALFFMPVALGSALMCVAFAEMVWRAITNTLPPLPSIAPTVEDEAAAGPGERG